MTASYLIRRLRNRLNAQREVSAEEREDVVKTLEDFERRLTALEQAAVDGTSPKEEETRQMGRRGAEICTGISGLGKEP